MRIINKSKNTVLANKGQLADTFLSRMVGLLAHSDLPSGEALVITRCNSIHMLFMRFAIDVIFVDKAHNVVGLVRDIKPFRLSRIYSRAFYAVECPVGVIDQTRTCEGDVIAWDDHH